MSESGGGESGTEKVTNTDPGAIAKSFLSTQEVPAWGEGVTGDFFNIVSALGLQTSDVELWSWIKPVSSVEQYVESNYPKAEDKEIRDLIIKNINPEFLSKANILVQEINAIIGTAVTTQGQADALREKRTQFSKLVYERQG